MTYVMNKNCSGTKYILSLLVQGNGTRKGSGQCSCDEGYKGLLCNECDASFYVSYKDDTKLLCSKCHPACQGTCTQAGVKGKSIAL